MWNQKPSFRFGVYNFSKKEGPIVSPPFVSGGCDWFLYLNLAENHMSVYLCVANTTLSRTGWKRIVEFYFVVLNQSDKELHRSPVVQACYSSCDRAAGWGYQNALPLSMLQEKGILENDKLLIEVYIKVLEVVDGEGEEDVVPKKKETVEIKINGFQILVSQATQVLKLFAEHPDIAEDFKPKNQMVKTAYMNVLLNINETLDKPSKNHSETDLSKAHIELCELIEQGFKLDWLKSKLDKVSLKRKKTVSNGSQIVQQLEERIKNLELMELGSLKSKLEVVSLVMKKAEDADEFRAQQLKESFQNLERMMKKSKDADGSRVQQLEERIKNLELMESGFKMDYLKSKLEEVSLEMKKAEADGSQAQQHEERINNLELMLSKLKVELDKKKAKSCGDEFLLI